MLTPIFSNQKGNIVITAKNPAGNPRTFQGIPTLSNANPEIADVTNNPGFPDQLSVVAHAPGTAQVTVTANNEVGVSISSVCSIPVLDAANAPADHFDFNYSEVVNQ